MKSINTNQLTNVKFLALLFVTMTTFSFAQMDKPYIDITGQIEYSREIERYTATIVISEDLAYSNYNEDISIEKLKSNYFEQLKSNNIAVSELKEDALAYTAMGYRKKGTVYQLETTSQEKLMKLLSINFSGVNVNDKYVHYKPLSSQQIEDLSRKAIINAKTRAKIIAKSAGKKLGELIYLSNYKEESKRRFYTTTDLTDHIFSVSAKYELQ